MRRSPARSRPQSRNLSRRPLRPSHLRGPAQRGVWRAFIMTDRDTLSTSELKAFVYCRRQHRDGRVDQELCRSIRRVAQRSFRDHPMKKITTRKGGPETEGARIEIVRGSEPPAVTPNMGTHFFAAYPRGLYGRPGACHYQSRPRSEAGAQPSDALECAAHSGRHM